MESQRRTPTDTTSPTPPAVIRPGLTSGHGFFAKHGNTILTVILLIVAGILAYQWYNRSANAARAAVIQQLDTARGNVDQLRSPQLLAGSMGGPLSSAEVMAKVRVLQSTAAGLVSDVMNKADEPAIKARALVVRGDLDWAMANLPELPGASTQPALKPETSADVLLGQASDAYTAALNTGAADKEATAAAHLGLAAVAENRGDWATAQQHLQTVADAKDGVAVLSQAARTLLTELPTLQKPMYIAPASGSEMPTVPTTQAILGPLGPARPTTIPAGIPTTLPTTSLPAMLPTTTPTSLPTTLPVK